MPFTITHAKLLVGYPSAKANDVEPGEVETAWRKKYPAQAADLDDACAQLLSVPVVNAATATLATKQALAQIDARLTITGATHQPHASAVDPNVAAYRGGTGGSHGGSAWLLERSSAGQWQHTVTVKVGGTDTTITVYPSVYVLAV